MKVYIRSSSEYDDLEFPDQQYSSAKTAVNAKSNKLPRIFRLIPIPQDAMILDYGGGSKEAERIANEFLAPYNSIDVVYDTNNITPEERSAALKAIRDNGGADATVCSNVLNVIAEESVRLSVLKNIRKLTKPGRPIYFTVHEGDGSGSGRVTGKDQYQNNRKTVDYLEEIQSVFPDATRRDKLIKCTNT